MLNGLSSIRCLKLREEIIMFKRLSTFILTTTALSFAGPSFAQTTLAELDASKEAAESVEVIPSPIDYTVYDTLMERAAVNQGGRPRVAYDFLRNQEVDYVSNYVSFLTEQDISTLSEDDKLAYWLNVQNIVTVQAILQDGKKANKRGLKKLRGTADAPGKLWTKPRVTIAGQTMSLQDIETKLLTEFDNPNVIYGIYQGVRGGPCLMRKAYRGANVNEVLVENAKQYVNSNGIVTVQRSVVELTPVFLWYKDIAFKGDDAVLLAHLKDNAKPTLKSALYRGRSFEATSLNYRLDNYDADKVAADRAASSRAAAARPAPRPAPQQQQRPRSGGYGS